MFTIKIKRATLSDLAILQKIGRQTFYEANVEDNTKENIDRYLLQNFSKEQLANELSNPYSVFYLAYIKDTICPIGYLKINFDCAQKEIKDKDTLEIQRIYVLKKYQGKSVGQFLLGEAVAIAKERHCKFIWLGVWEKNYSAIRFYEKNGFMNFGKLLFNLGAELHKGIMMKLELNESYDKQNIERKIDIAKISSYPSAK